MTIPRNSLFICLLPFMLWMLSCASPAKEARTGRQIVTVEEQNTKTLEALQEISRLSGDSGTNMHSREAAYADLINKYPDSQWVYECYNRLMLIYLSEYNPPAYDKAELVRLNFIKKYSDSTARNLLDDTLADAYYRHGKWTELIRLYTTSIKRFIEVWNLIRPRDMFLYAEAKFHLGDVNEARKAYNIILYYYPHSAESLTAKGRLEEIAGLSTQILEQGPTERPRNRVQIVESRVSPPQTVEAVMPPENVSPGQAAGKAAQEQKHEVEPPPPPPEMHEQPLYAVQLGFFGSEKNALALSEKYKKKGYDTYVVKHLSEDSRLFFRVLLGRFQDKAEAVAYADIFLGREGMKSLIFEQ